MNLHNKITWMSVKNAGPRASPQTEQKSLMTPLHILHAPQQISKLTDIREPGPEAAPHCDKGLDLFETPEHNRLC